MSAAPIAEVRLVLGNRVLDRRGETLVDAGVAVEDERIISVATRSELLARCGNRAAREELASCTLLPVRIDARTTCYPRFADSVRRLRDLGVRLTFGSNCGWGYTTFDENYLELDRLVEAGLSPVEALISANGAAADVLGLAGWIGSIRPGLAADLLLVFGDPTVDVRALRQVRAVWMG